MERDTMLRRAGIVATIAGLLAGTGDILLFSTPGFATDLFTVHGLPDWRIVSGTLLAIGVIPFLALGYWAFSRYLQRTSELLATAVFVGGLYGAGLGNAIHGVVGTLVQVVQRDAITMQNGAFVATYARFVVPLYALFYLLLAVGSLALAVVIWRGTTPLPRWFILLLPLWSNVLVLPLANVAPALGDVLVPSIANLSHAAMFGVMTALFWGREEQAARRSPAMADSAEG